jgi:hypothetical protein
MGVDWIWSMMVSKQFFQDNGMSSYRLGGLLGLVALALSVGSMPEAQKVRQQPKPKDWEDGDENEHDRNRRHLQRRNERRNKRQQGH